MILGIGSRIFTVNLKRIGYTYTKNEIETSLRCTEATSIYEFAFTEIVFTWQKLDTSISSFLIAIPNITPSSQNILFTSIAIYTISSAIYGIHEETKRIEKEEKRGKENRNREDGWERGE